MKVGDKVIEKYTRKRGKVVAETRNYFYIAFSHGEVWPVRKELEHIYIIDEE